MADRDRSARLGLAKLLEHQRDSGVRGVRADAGLVGAAASAHPSRSACVSLRQRGSDVDDQAAEPDRRRCVRAPV
jgi:hypothetical protein